jgi:hypothetical protein
VADPKREQTPAEAQAEYDALVALVKRGKEVRVAGRLVKSLSTLNDALDRKDDYDALVAQIEKGCLIRLNGRTAVTLDELHFALNALPAGPVAFVPAGVPMILGFGEQADANALQATIDEQAGTILSLQADKQSLTTEKEGLQAAYDCAKTAYTSEVAGAVALQTQVEGLTTERDEKAARIVALEAQVEELQQAAQVAADAAQRAAEEAAKTGDGADKPEVSAKSDAPQTPVETTIVA